MIRNEHEYKEAVTRLVAEQDRIKNYESKLREQGLSNEEMKRVIDPIRSFNEQLSEEIESYDRLKRREIDEIRNLRSLGHLLICLRIARNLSQRELAQRLGVNESQVSRDERNEYHGITLDRAAKVLEALDVDVRIGFEINEPSMAE